MTTHRSRLAVAALLSLSAVAVSAVFSVTLGADAVAPAKTVQVSRAAAGVDAPSMSSNGRYVVFTSGPTDASQITLWDRKTKTTRVVSAANGVAGNAASAQPSISPALHQPGRSLRRLRVDGIEPRPQPANTASVSTVITSRSALRSTSRTWRPSRPSSRSARGHHWWPRPHVQCVMSRSSVLQVAWSLLILKTSSRSQRLRHAGTPQLTHA